MTFPYASIPTGTLSGGPVTNGYQQTLARQSSRGIASLTHGTKNIVFRTSPNSVMWSYKLNTATENTYGGRVIQLLSTSMEDLKVVIECGLGGWNYAMQVAEFMRNMLIDQRDGTPGRFQYTTRGWDLKVYAVSIPFQDSVTETTRELELSFKIQEDMNAILTRQTVSAELAKLKEGIGFERTQFNSGAGFEGDGTTPPVIKEAIETGSTLVTGQIPAVDPFARQLGNIVEGNPFGPIGRVLGF